MNEGRGCLVGMKFKSDNVTEVLWHERSRRRGPHLVPEHPGPTGVPLIGTVPVMSLSYYYIHLSTLTYN